MKQRVLEALERAATRWPTARGDAALLRELRDALAAIEVRHDEMIGWYLADNGEALARLLSAKE